MISWKLIFILLLLGALIGGGFIEVRVHPERFRSIKAAVGNDSEASLGELLKTEVEKRKRQLEFWLIKDEARRVEVALLSATDDINDLEALLSEEDPLPSRLALKMGLLNQSLDQLDQLSQEVSIDMLAAMKIDSHELLERARALVPRIQAVGTAHETDAAFRHALTELQENLNLENVPAVPTETSAPSPAAEADQADNDTASVPATTIPLAF